MRWWIVALLGLALLPAFGAPEASAAPRLRAAVYEFADPSTHRVGAFQLLEKAGMQVAHLDVTRSPLEQDADLIVFGAFVDNVRAWRVWVAKHARDLTAFVMAGGVILEMSQSDDRTPAVRWLPEGCAILRSDRDVRTVRVVGKRTHPLLAWAPTRTKDGERFLDYKTAGRDPLSWEGFYGCRGVEVLMAEDAAMTRPQLVAGQAGKGRFIVTSLHIDKVFDSKGDVGIARESLVASRSFFRAIAKYVALVKAGKAPPVTPTLEPPVGPVVGHVGSDHAYLWYRPSSVGLYVLEVEAAGDGPAIRVRSESIDAADRTVQWQVPGLAPDTGHAYRVLRAGAVVSRGGSFHTAPAPDARARVRLAFGSCARATSNPVWDRIVSAGADGLVLLGNAPYIDSTRLATARKKHRLFLQVPEFADAVRSMPLWSTWGDHDFGKNGADGRLRGKAGPRQAYVEYRAQPRYGHDGKGIYTSFRYGPLEVFLLDTRWFAGTEPAPAAPPAPSCLGRAQWAWLRTGLKASTAPFKVLACGMVWTDKGNKETDHWETYAAERDALFEFLGAEGISGCVLVGGDVHVSRHLRHATEAKAGYALHELVVSPLHDGVLPAMDVAHPAKRWSAAEKHVFLAVEANTTASEAVLTARWVRADGKELYKVVLRAKDLAAKPVKRGG